jgi:drug/metabolite transporter (DMT)-like permease
MTSWAILAISIFAAVYVELQLKTIECFPLFKHEIRWQYCNGIFIAIAGAILSSFPVHVFFVFIMEGYAVTESKRLLEQEIKINCDGNEESPG